MKSWISWLLKAFIAAQLIFTVASLQASGDQTPEVKTKTINIIPKAGCPA